MEPLGSEESVTKGALGSQGMSSRALGGFGREARAVAELREAERRHRAAGGVSGSGLQGL